MLLTGLRSENAREAFRADMSGAALWIEKPKGHNPAKGIIKSFSLPLSTHALACIERAQVAQKRYPKMKINDLLFPSPRGGVFCDADLGVKVAASGHDLRHTWETIAEDLGHDSQILSRLMNHAQKSETGKYGNRHKIVRAPAETIQAINDAMMERIKL
jgi:integrase